MRLELGNIYLTNKSIHWKMEVQRNWNYLWGGVLKRLKIFVLDICLDILKNQMCLFQNGISSLQLI